MAPAPSVGAMTDTTASTVAPRPTAARAALLVAAGVAASALAAALLSLLGLALGADPTFAPLQPPAYLTFAILGALAAIGGWVLVVRLVRSSARVLRALVPALVALSLIPDVVLLLTGFIPGATPTGVVALMLMHPSVAAIAVLVGSRLAPAR